MQIALLIIGLIIGAVIGGLVQHIRLASKKGVPREKLEEMEELCRGLELQKAALEEKSRNQEADLTAARRELEEKNRSQLELREKLAREETERRGAEKRVMEQKKDFEEIKDRLKTDFENLANAIFEEKSKKFTKQNLENIDSILKPLGERIKEFREKVDNVYHTDTKERAELREKIASLTKLNTQLSEDAANLTTALKGQNKIMGNWGELVLERILENSGLIRDEEYIIQESLKGPDGRRLQPDVIIKLPEEKHLIIDSKVSLIAYERYCSTDDDDIRERALKEHISSVRTHVNSLSEKNYQQLNQLGTPDFVFMFIPLDPALILALREDPRLFQDAFEKNIYLVSPGTLLYSLRIIANIWKHEKQNRNAREIARQSGALYDKFVTFHNDLEKLGDHLNKARECYDKNLKRLKTGKGNLVSRVESLRKLGARTTKKLPADVRRQALEFHQEVEDGEEE